MSGRLFFTSLMTGLGTFNLVEGTSNHHLLEIHHVNETLPQDQWFWRDLGFLAWGALMLVVGVLMLRNWAEASVVKMRGPPLA